MTPERLAEAGLLLDVAGPVATITLNRPERRNAQTPLMWRTLAGIDAALPDDVRVVLVRGTGPTFSAGLDLAMLDAASDPGTETVAGLVALDDEALLARIAEYQAGFTFLRDPRFVSVAVVQGHAVGAGFQLALSCDLRVLTTDAVLCMREAVLGLVPDLTGTRPLLDIVGYARALELCATARDVPATEALQLGLANVVVAPEEVDATVGTVVAGLTAAPVGAVREIKGLLLDAGQRDLTAQRLAERQAQVRRLRDLLPARAGQE